MEETETSCNVLCEQPNQVNLTYIYLTHIYNYIYIGAQRVNMDITIIQCTKYFSNEKNNAASLL